MRTYFSTGAALLTVLVLALSGCDFGSDNPEMDVVQGNLCTSDSDCDGGGVCDLTSGTCVGCVSDSDCATGRFCNTEKQQCVACIADDNCATGVCDEDAGICIECEADSDCASGKCNEATGVCLECGVDSDCATGNPCEVGACMQGQCIYGNLPEGVACDDGDPCTVQDSCVNGQCVPGILDPDCEIPTDPCEELVDGTSCDDGDPCTLDDFCFGGICVGDTVAPECLGQDVDADGFSVDEGDCNDLNPEIHPEALELCDGQDNDCDGEVDEGCQTDCVVSGCSAEICASEPMDSDCMWLPEYECLKFAICGPYSADGSCGWLETPEYLTCMENIQQPCTSNMDCAPGQICMNGMCLSGPLPCTTDDECALGQVCMNGTCVFGDNQCESQGGACFPYNDRAMSPTQCPPGTAQVDLSGCTSDEICCMNVACTGEVCGDGIDNDCDGEIDEDCPVECIDLSNVNFGACAAIIGVGFVNGQCMGISGCSCGDYCNAIFETIEECKIACDVSLCANVLCEPGFVCDPETGACIPESSSCFVDDQCTAGQYCYFANCAVETGECVVIPTMCPSLWAPVCACNGQTYANLCTLQAAQADLDHQGECGAEDADGDGFTVPEDCDDYDPQVFPGATELCDGMDNDCDGTIDEECAVECIDLSNVNFGVCLAIIGVGFVNGQCMGISGCSCGNYCNAIFDTVEECKVACDISLCANVQCQSGFVCDPETGACIPDSGSCFADDQCAATQYCYFASCAVETGQCTQVPEICPDLWAPVCACSGQTYANLCDLQAAQENLHYSGECGTEDADGDGFPVPQDCDDNNAQVFPGAPELCDGMDNDCDGEVDENCGLCVDLSNVDFGDCEMILGIGLVNGQCQTISGCGCGDYCDAFFQSMEKCKTTCTQTNACVEAGAFCEAQFDPTFPSYCPAGSAEVDLGGCALGEICCMPITTPCTSSADCAAGEVCQNGECVANAQYCWIDEQCAQGSYCYYSDCAVETGTCQVMPVSCPYLWDPVCSCEGVTYANLCILMAQGQDLKHEGECTTNATCQNDSDCEPWQACVNGVCLDLPD